MRVCDNCHGAPAEPVGGEITWCEGTQYQSTALGFDVCTTCLRAFLATYAEDKTKAEKMMPKLENTRSSKEKGLE